MLYLSCLLFSLTYFLASVLTWKKSLVMLVTNWLTLSGRWSSSYRNQSTDLQRKSMDWFLYDKGHYHERVKGQFVKAMFLRLKN